MTDNPPDTQPQSAAERQRKFAIKQRSYNRIQRSIWASADEHGEIKLLLHKMRKK